MTDGSQWRRRCGNDALKETRFERDAVQQTRRRASAFIRRAFFFLRKNFGFLRPGGVLRFPWLLRRPEQSPAMATPVLT